MLLTMCCALLLGFFKSIDLLNNTLVSVIGFWCFLQVIGFAVSAAVSKHLVRKYSAQAVPRETIG